MMEGLRCSDCLWLYKSGKRPEHIPKSFSTWQQKTLQNLINWTVKSFILPLVKSCFYVTESGLHRKRVFYYRRTTWAAMQCLAKDSCLGRNFLPVNEKAVKDAISEKKTFGCGKIRFIPKANKLRPIMNLKYDGSHGKGSVSAKFQLERLLHVLKLLTREQPMLLGSTVTDMDEVGRRLKNLSNTRKETGVEGSPLYFVASDIECCFDSIPHGKLVQVIEKVMQKDYYYIRKFSKTSYITFKQCLTLTKRVASDDAGRFPAFMEEYLNSKDCTISNSVITDGVFCAKEQRQFLCRTLKKHLHHCYIKFGSKFYRLVRGNDFGLFLPSLLRSLLYFTIPYAKCH